MKFNRIIPAAVVVALGLSVAPAFADGDGGTPAPQPPSMGSVILSVPNVHPVVVVDKE